MNAEELKALIKEAVAEVLRDHVDQSLASYAAPRPNRLYRLAQFAQIACQLHRESKGKGAVGGNLLEQIAQKLERELTRNQGRKVGA